MKRLRDFARLNSKRKLKKEMSCKFETEIKEDEIFYNKLELGSIDGQ